MKVKEAIEILKEYDPEDNFEVVGNDGCSHNVTFYGYVVSDKEAHNKVMFIFKEADIHESL